MLQKGSKLYSILTGSCPRCQQECMYKEPNPYVITRLFAMYERCSHCDTKYKMEPSFFYGAMYVSYAVGVAFAVAAFIVAYGFVGASLLQAFVAIVLTLVVCMPVIVRLSRNIWINFFIHYNADAAKEGSGE